MVILEHTVASNDTADVIDNNMVDNNIYSGLLVKEPLSVEEPRVIIRNSVTPSKKASFRPWTGK